MHGTAVLPHGDSAATLFCTREFAIVKLAQLGPEKWQIALTFGSSPSCPVLLWRTDFRRPVFYTTAILRLILDRTTRAEAISMRASAWTFCNMHGFVNVVTGFWNVAIPAVYDAGSAFPIIFSDGAVFDGLSKFGALRLEHFELWWRIGKLESVEVGEECLGLLSSLK